MLQYDSFGKLLKTCNFSEFFVDSEHSYFLFTYTILHFNHFFLQILPWNFFTGKRSCQVLKIKTNWRKFLMKRILHKKTVVHETIKFYFHKLFNICFRIIISRNKIWFPAFNFIVFVKLYINSKSYTQDRMKWITHLCELL